MDKSHRKDIVREYKEQTPRQGIFAVRGGGRVWVSASRNLDKQQNQIWFGLRNGGFVNAALQAAWTLVGEAAFAYEILEVVTDENPLLIPSLLKDREAHWRAKFGADKVFG